MPESMFTLFPHVQHYCQSSQLPCLLGAQWLGFQHSLFRLSSGLMENGHAALSRSWRPREKPPAGDVLLDTQRKCGAFLIREINAQFQNLEHTCRYQAQFYGLFTGNLPRQKWDFEKNATGLLLDLPGFRVYDLSRPGSHRVQNYTVVFAPRAGHHSNIAERLAIQLRDYGLTRLAIVEQKCAQEIPVTVNGTRHHENFDGQYRQYREILSFLKARTGHPSHLVAVCQPGPLLMSTLILNPELGRTFGSAGSPMHTRAQNGLLTSFARLMGESYVDRLVQGFNRVKVDAGTGQVRKMFDGRMHVLGFYLLGLKQHIRNLAQLQRDIYLGEHKKTKRQLAFYRWYNYVHHFPAGFIRDTYQQIFVRNALVEGTLIIDGHSVKIGNYPSDVPIWALGGRKDDIAPPRQAVGHMDLMDHLPAHNRLSILCNGGHMALFRSSKILANEYRRIAQFIMANSDTC